MKKILNLLVYRPNRWYDNLEEPFRFLMVLLVLILPISILMGLELYLAYVVYVCSFVGWRLVYFARPKTKYVFDIETSSLYDPSNATGQWHGGQHNSNFDYAFMVKREKEKEGEKPEIIDAFTMMTKINKKK